MSFSVLTSLDEVRDFTSRQGVLVFSTTWCQPCKKFRPHFEKASESVDVPFAYVYADEVDGILENYDVTSVPDVRLYRDGNGDNTFETLPHNVGAVAFIKEVESRV